MFQNLKFQHGKSGRRGYVVYPAAPPFQKNARLKRPACTNCKVKKLKCDYQGSSCLQCLKDGIDCSSSKAPASNSTDNTSAPKDREPSILANDQSTKQRPMERDNDLQSPEMEKLLDWFEFSNDENGVTYFPNLIDEITHENDKVRAMASPLYTQQEQDVLQDQHGDKLPWHADGINNGKTIHCASESMVQPNDGQSTTGNKRPRDEDDVVSNLLAMSPAMLSLSNKDNDGSSSENYKSSEDRTREMQQDLSASSSRTSQTTDNLFSLAASDFTPDVCFVDKSQMTASQSGQEVNTACNCRTRILSANANMQVMLAWDSSTGGPSSQGESTHYAYQRLQCQKEVLKRCEKILNCRKCEASLDWIMLVRSICREMVDWIVDSTPTTKGASSTSATMDDIASPLSSLSSPPSVSQHSLAATSSGGHYPISELGGGRDKSTTTSVTTFQTHGSGYGGVGNNFGTNGWQLDSDDEIQVLKSLISARVTKLQSLIDLLEKTINAYYSDYQWVASSLKEHFAERLLVRHRVNT